ncbi:MAG: bifunctional riboflavin kinase/FAD synthetase [Gammaproteobacteria bacterium]
MKLLRGFNHIPAAFPRCVATIGNFDGVHLGHQALLSAVKQQSERLQLPSLLIVFEPQPNEFFGRNVPARLMRLREKLLAVQKFGLDYVLCLRFDAKLAELSPEAFVETLLVQQLNVAHLIVGDDFHFGRGRGGNIALLQQIGLQRGFTAQALETYRLNGERVSSSRIRVALQAGDLTTASALLGKPYGMSGKVVHGNKLGRLMGFPTANLYLHRKVVPLQGIHVVKTYGLSAEPIEGVANIGNRPALGGGRVLLEVHLFNFNADIYGKHIYIEFLHKLRDEAYYPSLELLREQISKDVDDAKKFFSEENDKVK